MPVGTFNQPVGGVEHRRSIAAGIDDPSSTICRRCRPALTLGVGRIASTGMNFAAMLRALQGDSQHQHHRDALDRHARQRGGGDQGRAGSAVRHRLVHQHRQRQQQARSIRSRPMQREEVGTILKITPQINEGDARCMLKIEQEARSVARARRRRGRPDHEQAHDHAPTCSSRTAASSCSAA